MILTPLHLSLTELNLMTRWKTNWINFHALLLNTLQQMELRKPSHPKLRQKSPSNTANGLYQTCMKQQFGVFSSNNYDNNIEWISSFTPQADLMHCLVKIRSIAG